MEETKKTSKWRKLLKVGKHLAILTFLLAGSYALGKWIDMGRDYAEAKGREASQWIEKQLTREVVVHQFIDPEAVPTEMLIEQVAAEEQIPSELLKAMAVRESGHWSSTNRIRYEAHIFRRNQKSIPTHLNEIERQLWASSHGIGQVIFVLHKERCGLSNWIELHDGLTNLRCTAKVFKSRWERFRDIKNPKDRLFMALRAYNGDVDLPETADYAVAVMNNMVLLRTKAIMGGV